MNKAQGLDYETGLDKENNRSCVAASQVAAIIFMCVKGRDGLCYKKKWGLSGRGNREELSQTPKLHGRVLIE